MANEVLFVGGRLDSVAVTTGAPTEVTTAGSFDSSYADASIAVFTTDVLKATFQTVSGSALAATDVVTGEILYAHFELYFATNVVSSTTNFVELQNSSSQPWLALRGTVNGTYGLYYNSNTGASPTWTQLGANQTFAAATKYIFDIKLTLGSPHAVEFSVNSSSVISTTFTQSSLTALRSLNLNGVRSSTPPNNYSQIICTRGISTINAKVKTSRATAAGTNSAWTGAYTDVNEAINSDATINTSVTAAQKQSYAMGDVTIPSSYVISTVFNWLRAKNDGVAPNNIKSLLRSGATDYSSANVTGLGTSFGPVGMRYDTDPATAAAWTQTNWNAVEAGYESAT